MHVNWKPHPYMPYECLQGFTCALVRTKPDPQGMYLWQFRKVVGYAASVAAAKDYVEAGAEYFETFRRNPYAP